ncbi:TPA: hypothetical protein ACH3X2_012916 [Trebouxia sp. C0005]|nr:MAG: hypothetical protein FRX49_05165 [Trebouxia sp. A1-2]
MRTSCACMAIYIVACASFLCALCDDQQMRCSEGVWWGSEVVGPDSLLIAARYEEDVSWMALHLTGVMPFVVYNTLDSSATHHTPVRNGNEAAAYLQFIVDYYNCLPQHMAFIHAHRCDAGFDKDADVQLIQWGTIPSFASLNRAGFLWHIHLSQHVRHLNKNDYHHKAAHGITTAWQQVLGHALGPLPDELFVQGGSQFVVQKHRVLAHPRAFYHECLSWLADSTELSSWDKGMVFEYTWKLVFGEPAETLDQNVWD